MRTWHNTSISVENSALAPKFVTIRDFNVMLVLKLYTTWGCRVRNWLQSFKLHPDTRDCLINRLFPYVLPSFVSNFTGLRFQPPTRSLASLILFVAIPDILQLYPFSAVSLYFISERVQSPNSFTLLVLNLSISCYHTTLVFLFYR